MPKFNNVNNFSISSTPWIMKNVVPTNSICMISGENGELNSLFATELALHISSGNSWNGHEINSAKSTIYFTQASQLAMAKRKRNWVLENNYNRTLPFFLSNSKSSLFGEGNYFDLLNELSEFLALQGIKRNLGVILIDIAPYLYNAVCSNSNKPTVRQLIKLAEHIRTEFNCTVLLVHNQGAVESSRAFKYLYKHVDMVMRAEQMGEPLDNVILFSKFTDHKLPKPIFVERFLKPMLGGTADE